MTTNNQALSTPTTGISVQGIVKGYFEKQNGQYTNRILAVVTGSYFDKYNQEVENVEDIAVGPKMAQYVSSIIDQIENKPVRVWIGVQHKKGEKNGKAWSFVSYFLRENGIEMLDTKQSKAA